MPLGVSCILNTYNSFSPHLCGILYFLKVSSYYFTFQTPIPSSLHYFPFPPIFFLSVSPLDNHGFVLEFSSLFSPTSRISLLMSCTRDTKEGTKVFFPREIQVTYLRNSLTPSHISKGSMLI